MRDLCKNCTGLSAHRHFAVVTMLKDSHQQVDRQVRNPLSTLIMAQSSRFLDSPTLLYLYCGQTQGSVQVDKLLCDQSMPGSWLFSSCLLTDCTVRGGKK